MEFDLSAYAALEPIYAAGIAGLVQFGEDFMTCFFRWGFHQENGLMVREKIPALAIIRPVSSVSSDGTFARRLAAQRVAVEVVQGVRHH